jgi:preprotein translocase subunit SecF
VLFVGMLSGTYSSIFIATPVLADLKERDPRYKELAVKVNRRLAGGRAQRAAGETAGATADAATAAVSATSVGATAVTLRDAPDEYADEAVEQEDSDGVAVPAASRPVVRQQRVTGSAQRRPGARRKRR